MKIEDIAYYTNGILAKDRNILSKAITIIESSADKHEEIAQKIIDFCFHQNKKSKKIGISGSPGVGKSTFINSIGKYLINEQKSLAILAIDPSSSISKGSILGDKTRMVDLVQNSNVFIRPTANGDYLGGVSRKTYETSILCEAFGFDYIIIETVGVGQSEIEVKNIADLLVLLLLPNAGDELQGIKRGIMELADIIVINKAENDNASKATISATQIKSILPLLRHKTDWEIKVLTASSQENLNIENVYNLIQNYFTTVDIEAIRTQQKEYWSSKIIAELVYKQIKNSQLMLDCIHELNNKHENIYTNIHIIKKYLNKFLINQ